MSEKNNQNEPVIDIVGSSALEYVFECLSKFNVGNKKVIIRSFGGNVSKGIEVARLLQKKADISIQNCELDNLELTEGDIPFMVIHLEAGKTRLDKNLPSHKETVDDNLNNFNYINYSTYHLLFDWYLSRWGSLKISTRDRDQKAIPLLDIQEEKGKRKYKVYKAEELAKREEINAYEVSNALTRSGFFTPRQWNDIGCRLSEYDDIILGLDTNILFNCTISKHLLPVLSLVEPKEFVHTPNWILLIVPSTVMYELEEATNIRDDRGMLLHKGRIGFRSLQEIMDLSENIDIPGISLLIHGDTNPELDIKNSLVGIRKDINRIGWEIKNGNLSNYKPFKKSSAGDMAIRYQFKKFLNQIDFHKGTFFLTSDKSNSAMAQAEGLCPIYLPNANLSFRDTIPFFPPQYPAGGKNLLNIDVPLGNIIYELAVSFGEIIISCKGKSPSIECERRGDDIGRWMRKQLRIPKKDLTLLLKDYKGKFNLAAANDIHNEISERFESVKWLSNMGGAFKSKE